MEGGKRELNDYLGFLKGGCSKFPLDLLRDAGVDMEKPEPVETALEALLPTGRRAGRTAMNRRDTETQRKNGRE